MGIGEGDPSQCRCDFGWPQDGSVVAVCDRSSTVNENGHIAYTRNTTRLPAPSGVSPLLPSWCSAVSFPGPVSARRHVWGGGRGSPSFSLTSTHTQVRLASLLRCLQRLFTFCACKIVPPRRHCNGIFVFSSRSSLKLFPWSTSSPAPAHRVTPAILLRPYTFSHANSSHVLPPLGTFFCCIPHA